eukprot:4111713-Prymnesium_polylepis.1
MVPFGTADVLQVLRAHPARMCDVYGVPQHQKCTTKASFTRRCRTNVRIGQQCAVDGDQAHRTPFAHFRDSFPSLSARLLQFPLHSARISPPAASLQQLSCTGVLAAPRPVPIACGDPGASVYLARAA